MITADLFKKDETIVTIGDYKQECPKGKRSSTPSLLLMISRRCIGLTSSPQIALKHSIKSWNASLIAPNTFIQSPFTNRKIEPLIDNKGSHIGSLLLSFLRYAVCFTFVEKRYYGNHFDKSQCAARVARTRRLTTALRLFAHRQGVCR